MKIAVISDIHGNLPAHEAALADIHKRKLDKIVCLGDIIGKGPSSKETIDICRAHCDLIVQGNWDAGLYAAYCELQSDAGADVSVSIRWYIADAGAERIEYLGSLPHCAELYLSGKLVRLFHAHPVNFNRYFGDSPVAQRLELFGYAESESVQKEADVAVYADIHSAYMQLLQGKMLINVGSVGNPLEITQASYVVLEGEDSGNASDSLNVQFVRVPYDIDLAVSLARNSGVPDLEGYISELTTAKYYKRG